MYGRTAPSARRHQVIVAASLMLFCCVGPALAVDHVNVIIIYADDLGWGDLACYGHPTFKTPNLDRLAAEGARLTNFYSSCPYCAPSRASLQTGRYQVRSGVTRNPCPDAGVNDVGMPDSEITLGEAFKTAGYATICIGKWHLGHRTEFMPRKHGYDEYLEVRENWLRTFRRRLRQIGRHQPGGRVLDVGCGPGFFLDAARDMGYDCLLYTSDAADE